MQELLRSYDTTVAAQLTGSPAVCEAVAASLGVTVAPLSTVKAWVDTGLVTPGDSPTPSRSTTTSWCTPLSVTSARPRGRSLSTYATGPATGATR